ncbi:hypothetical protein TD95_004124 [Thielaviopsis punctulata]|uniref:Phosphatidate phosphatase APP1 catalytic domain-containing protein n=1 Tax=Thielaviopsis punctulata TaxID=72032 RepID=A0A0F4ZBD5_9PEZI|nr:hypothetical protein TD95_004124 [Thielaviopsis punctulata]
MSWAVFGGGSSGSSDDINPGQRGYRRQKLAAMAGSVYRAGASAVGEIRDTYAQSRDAWSYEIGEIESMATSFPECGIVTQGHESLLVFPTYAKRHAPPPPRRRYTNYDDEVDDEDNEQRNDEQWVIEWERTVTKESVVDVDVRGWVFVPQRPPLTKRMRLMVAVARSMSGIPMGKQDSDVSADEAAIAKAEVERISAAQQRSATTDFDPTISRRNTSNSIASGAEMTAEEVAAANNTLMKRISPFLTSPLVQVPVTLFFYNDTHSQSRTVYTNESGQFFGRVALNFMPTDTRVMVNGQLSSSALSKRFQVNMIEETGISVISDVDDTVKFSNVTGGPREILRNTFVRDLETLTVDGVSEWYNAMASLGVRLHYCSNSPWQVWPLLSGFFRTAKLPFGSMHLKQYNGMLQGMWEPAANRKRPTLERLLKDFPRRKFILIGDSGEADLELYVDLAITNPRNILGIFIRDVTTPETAKEAQKIGLNSRQLSDTSMRRPSLHPRTGSTAPTSFSTPPPPPPPPRSRTPRKEELLIDLSESPKVSPQLPARPDLSDAASKKPKPPRPTKPTALQCSNGTPPISTTPHAISGTGPSRPIARKPTNLSTPSPVLRPKPSLPNVHTPPDSSNARTPPPAPPPRRRTTGIQTPSTSGTTLAETPKTTNGTGGQEHAPGHPHLGPALAPMAAMTSAAAAAAPEAQTPVAVQRKVDAWHVRLKDAQWKLDNLGIPLYTWRRGGDVMEEALGLVKEQL